MYAFKSCWCENEAAVLEHLKALHEPNGQTCLFSWALQGPYQYLRAGARGVPPSQSPRTFPSMSLSWCASSHTLLSSCLWLFHFSLVKGKGLSVRMLSGSFAEWMPAVTPSPIPLPSPSFYFSPVWRSLTSLGSKLSTVFTVGEHCGKRLRQNQQGLKC